MTRAPLFLLYLNVLVVATCGLIYELLAGTLASYVLGDSVTQFSLVIGVYLSALGVGAWLSRFVTRHLVRAFVEVELAVALLGGTSAPLLFFAFGRLSWFPVVLFGVVFAIGVLVGLELPLLMRILKEHLDFSDLVSRVLAFDYIGALLASLMFPLFLIPRLGLVRTSLVFGILNALVGLWGTWLLKPLMDGRLTGLRLRGIAVIALLAAGVAAADRLTELAEEQLFPHPVVFTRTTSYQRIVVTESAGKFQLFLNGNLQFNSADEYRYHEALVHPALLSAGTPRRVLVLGGGDGLAVREILKHSAVEAVTLVDIDPEMTGLAEKYPPLRKLNGAALQDRRVSIVHADAMIWLEHCPELFDAAIVDFPDPNTYSLGKLYTTRFYRLLKARLTPEAAVSIQCTSPLVARSSFWCIVRTLESAGFVVDPYQATVPSFGVWGYCLARTTAGARPAEVPAELQTHLRFLNNRTYQGLFDIPEDASAVPVEINRLDNQTLVRYYEAEWKHWN
ncbi:MAG: polyamine aminopropyltransferase [Planctomycetia bacterium]|nr:polyamine aminopropyltransferase [Planctomycetia bacterium]